MLQSRVGNKVEHSYLIKFIKKFSNRSTIFLNHIDNQPYYCYGREGLWGNHIYFFGQKIQAKPSSKHVGS